MKFFLNIKWLQKFPVSFVTKYLFNGSSIDLG